MAADLASAAQGLTGADIAYLCQRAAMFCVKDAVGANDTNEGIAITRHHFDSALALLTAAHATDATPEAPNLRLDCFLDDQERNNEKVTQMEVAHVALRNSFAGLTILILLMFGI